MRNRSVWVYSFGCWSVNIIGQKIFKLAVWRQQFQSALLHSVGLTIGSCTVSCIQYIYIYTYVQKWWQPVNSSPFDYLLQKRGKQLQNWIPKMVKECLSNLYAHHVLLVCVNQLRLGDHFGPVDSVLLEGTSIQHSWSHNAPTFLH